MLSFNRLNANIYDSGTGNRVVNLKIYPVIFGDVLSDNALSRREKHVVTYDALLVYPPRITAAII